MAGRLQGKVAVVTGGASGIGAATCRLFVGEGARVIVADRQEPLDAEFKAFVSAQPESISFTRCDVVSEADMRAVVETAVQKWGRLDIIVACAGVPGQGNVLETTSDEWDHTFAVNSRGVFYAAKYAIPEMLKVGGGSIINISSAFGIVAGPRFSAYAASKAAVRNFCKSVAIDFGAQGKYAFHWTRLSCRKFRDNEVRLQLHALAYNLAIFLRCIELPETMADWSLTSLQLKLIKIGARVVRHARAITFQLAEVAVTGPMVRAILAAIRRLRAPPLCA